jgi:ribonucleoside-diphosphate reductase alpha chain
MNQEIVYWSKPPEAVRHRLPRERKSVNHKFHIGINKFWIIVGLYPDGNPGELFVYSHQGTTIHGLLDAWAITLSMALQHGVPLESVCDKLSFMRFEPSGATGSEEFGIASSVVDYIARWLAKKFLNKDYRAERPTNLNGV